LAGAGRRGGGVAIAWRNPRSRSVADYEALALSLAREPERLAGLRAKLANARERSAPFDRAGYCRHLEAAYVAMMQRHRDGAVPARFAVAP
jgi:predicted O-linked N-acetylglucosamine transferase (SPINDLY family)